MNEPETIDINDYLEQISDDIEGGEINSIWNQILEIKSFSLIKQQQALEWLTLDRLHDMFFEEKIWIIRNGNEKPFFLLIFFQYMLRQSEDVIHTMKVYNEMYDSNYNWNTLFIELKIIMNSWGEIIIKSKDEIQKSNAPIDIEILHHLKKTLHLTFFEKILDYSSSSYFLSSIQFINDTFTTLVMEYLINENIEITTSTIIYIARLYYIFKKYIQYPKTLDIYEKKKLPVYMNIQKTHHYCYTFIKDLFVDQKNSPGFVSKMQTLFYTQLVDPIEKYMWLYEIRNKDFELCLFRVNPIMNTVSKFANENKNPHPQIFAELLKHINKTLFGKLRSDRKNSWFEKRFLEFERKNFTREFSIFILFLFDIFFEQYSGIKQWILHSVIFNHTGTEKILHQKRQLPLIIEISKNEWVLYFRKFNNKTRQFDNPILYMGDNIISIMFQYFSFIHNMSNDTIVWDGKLINISKFNLITTNIIQVENPFSTNVDENEDEDEMEGEGEEEEEEENNNNEDEDDLFNNLQDDTEMLLQAKKRKRNNNHDNLEYPNAKKRKIQ